MALIRIELGQRFLTAEGRRAERTAARERKRKRKKRHWWSRDAHERARVQHRALLAMLGGKCAECESTDRLEVDHVEGRTWRNSSLAFRDRVRRYWREFRAGVKLRALCRACNGALGANLKRRYSRPAH